MKTKLQFRLLAVLSLLLAAMPAHIVPEGEAAQAAPAASVAPTGLLQFTSGGHALGFAADGMYAATGSHALHVDFAGANSVQPQADSPASADDIAAPLSRVAYANLWDGITLTYTVGAGSIYTTTYNLTPGAEPADIRLRYNAPLTLNDDGTLSIAFETGTMTESAPIAWQDINSQRVPVNAAFQVRGQEASFALGAYDPAYPLTIDPTLVWNTFLGGSGDDQGSAIAVDGSGNVYVAGSSDAPWSCSPSPCTVRPYTANSDAFAAKLSSTGSLTWNTFLGGSGIDGSSAIAVDGSGNVYVAGQSDASWGTPGSYTADLDAFAAKLDPFGALTWNTFLGGSGSDFLRYNGIAVDGSGNVYVAGTSTASWGSPVRSYTASDSDAFAAKLGSSGALTWNTFLGGSGYDEGWGIAVHGGYVFVVGGSNASWGSPVRSYTYSPTWGADAFAAKLSSTGGLTWNTFLGGSGNDGGWGIAVDVNRNVYVVGGSNASWGTPVHGYIAGDDAFAAKLSFITGALTWNTFLGGSGNDSGRAIAVDGSGNVYVAGDSDASWGSPVRPYTDYSDAFAAKLSSTGSLARNTFLGGSGNDYGSAIAVGGSGKVYVAGTSSSSWSCSPTACTVRGYTAGFDAFAAKVDLVPQTLTFHSTGAQDGWVLESTETSSIGGTLNAIATTFRLGDDAQDRQYRAILSFDTASLPNNAVITKVTLKIKKQGTVGTSPFNTHGYLLVDIRRGTFSGNPVLQVGDFQAAANMNSVGAIPNTPVSGWYTKTWTSGGIFANINKIGLTQLRLRFQIGDNDDMSADYLKFYSGNAGTSTRPQFIIEYYVP